MLSEGQLSHIGERIKEMRKKRGLTQSELAEALGLETVSAISKIENGNLGRQPTFWKLAAIAKELGCSLDELIDESSNGDEND